MKRTMNMSLAVLLIVTLAACGSRTLGGGNDNTNNNDNTNLNPGDECQTGEDCRVARKWDVCCSCTEAVSDADLAADPCLIPLEQSSVPDQCFIGCPEMECPLCPELGRTVDCLSGECGWKEGRCTDDVECVAAIRVDSCCQQAFAATHDDIAADPCLTYWPHYWEEIPAQCWDAWPAWCDDMDCADAPPPSRAMYCASDGCAYGSECSTPNDCTLMVNHRSCCGCPAVWPAAMVGHDPCVLPVGETPPLSCFPEACLGVQCEQCPESPQLGCLPDGVCVGLWADAPAR